MAVLPRSATIVHLLKGIPFVNDYKDTRWFDSLSEQRNYFLNKPRVHSMTDSTIQHHEDKSYVSVNRNIEELRNVNYMMFQNSNHGNKWFYAFVTSLEYKNNATTYVHIELDVFQTWLFEMDFKPSYVLREHRRLWNSDGSPVINTLDEGLDYGTDYDIVSVENWKPLDDIFFFVIVMKTAVHTSQAGETGFENEVNPTINGMPQGLTYLIHPFRMKGSNPNVQIGGQNYTINDTLDMLKGVFTQTDMMNNVVSMYVTEYIGHMPSYDSDSDTLNFNDTMFERAMIADDENQNVNTIAIKNLPDYSSKSKNFGNKYDGFRETKESKLLMYPYTVTILDDFKGNRVEIKNEYIRNNELIITARGSVGTMNKVVYGIRDYLTEGLETHEKITVSMESSLINDNPNDVPVLNDYLSAFLQGNKHQIATQKDSAFFNGIMSVAGSTVGGVGAGRDSNPIGVGSSVVGGVQGAGQAFYNIKAINSKIKDINNIPPNVIKMGSNTAFDYGNGYEGLYIIKKQITPEYQKRLEDFFNMFGYKTNETKIPNFHTRRYWNFVQTESCVITGDFNQEDLNDLKQIFDNGITLWHTDDVGNYSLDNEVI